MKGKVYKTVARPATLYGLEAEALTKRQEAELEVATIRDGLRWFERSLQRRDAEYMGRRMLRMELPNRSSWTW